MLGKPVVFILFALAAYLTLYRSAVVAFVTLYLPSLILLNATAKINLPGLPDMNATYGIIYGIIGGLVMKGGEPFPFKWGWMDTLMMLLTFSVVITGMTTEYVYTGISIFGEQMLGYLAPYFLARVMFHDPAMRRRAPWLCVFCAFVVAFFALIEIRLWPYFMSRTMKSFGLYTGPTGQVLWRWNLMRAQTSFDHPIDMGNGCLLLAGMIAIFAMTTSVGLRSIYVQLAIAASVCASLTSLSFTSYVGVAVAGASFTAFYLFGFTRKIVVLFVLVMFCGFAGMTYRLYNVDVEKRYEEVEKIGESVQDSMFVRAMIIQNSMPFATTSGPFGYGNKIRHSQLALESVDNSYMLFLMRRGWAFVALFLFVPVLMAWRATRAFARAQDPVHWMPLAAGVALVLGIMCAMYTVWFGFAYSVLWTMMVGYVMSMCDVLIYGAPTRPMAAPARPRYPQQRGYAMASGA